MILGFWTPVPLHCTIIPVQSNVEMLMCAGNASNLNRSFCGTDHLNDEYQRTIILLSLCTSEQYTYICIKRGRQEAKKGLLVQTKAMQPASNAPYLECTLSSTVFAK